jgi:hypothetical protein
VYRSSDCETARTRISACSDCTTSRQTSVLRVANQALVHLEETVEDPDWADGGVKLKLRPAARSECGCVF